jgi:hypothetical protein
MSCEAPPTQSKPATIAAERFWRTREADEHAQSVLCNIVKALVKMIPTFQKGAQSSLPYKRKFYAFHSWEPSINNFDLGFCLLAAVTLSSRDEFCTIYFIVASFPHLSLRQLWRRNDFSSKITIVLSSMVALLMTMSLRRPKTKENDRSADIL